MTLNPETRIPEELLPHEDKSRAYSAIRGKRVGGLRVLRLLFVPKGGTHNRRVPLSDLKLQDVAKNGTEIILEFSELTVKITGRNLATVDQGIDEGFVAAVEAFDADLRDMPQDAKTPVIESITFHPKGQKVELVPPRAKPRLVKTDAESV